jgi:hypothetical protein
MIAAIGPEQRFWLYGEETALTIIPSFLVSGILSVILGIIVMGWAIFFIDHKHSGGILMMLSLALFLVGGGFAPIFMALIASLTATRINKPLRFWHRVILEKIQIPLGRIWRSVLVMFVILFIFSVIVAIFGWPMTYFFDDETAFRHLNTLSLVMVGMMLLAVISSFAYDLQQQTNREYISHEQ